MGVEVAIRSAATISKVAISNGHCTCFLTKGRKLEVSDRTWCTPAGRRWLWTSRHRRRKTTSFLLVRRFRDEC